MSTCRYLCLIKGKINQYKNYYNLSIEEDLAGIKVYIDYYCSSTVGSTVQFKVQSTEEMEVPYLLIFGTKGIIHSQNFEDAVGKDVFDFPLELTDEMRPEARGLVFYMRASDGAIVYDEFSLSIGFSIDNSVSLSL